MAKELFRTDGSGDYGKVTVFMDDGTYWDERDLLTGEQWSKDDPMSLRGEWSVIRGRVFVDSYEAIPEIQEAYARHVAQLVLA